MASTVVCMPSSYPALSSYSAFRGSTSFAAYHHPKPSHHHQRLIFCADLNSSPSAATTLKKGKATPKRPKVMLRFVWMEKNIGIGLDQVVSGHGTVPLSSYYFWPRKDAWEEIKTKLENKKWISRKQTILLLNQATDVINLWQQNAAC